jgi:thiol-disulfide isomerase/thioredoxin
MNSSPVGHFAGRGAIWVSCLTVCIAASAAGARLRVGDVPPDVFGRSATGEAVHLSDYKGRIVVISFWATWCSPCRKEQPMLMALQKQATREKLVVLSVNWRQAWDTFREVKKIYQAKAPDVTLISDDSGRAGDAYGVRAIPHMIIVGRDGRIAAIHVGYSEAQMPSLVDEINATWRQTAPQSP